MSESGELLDNPNQQVVRPDGSGPGDEGEGGSTHDEAESGSLDKMTKAELLEHAQQLGVSPANNDMTKDELRAGIEAHQAEEG